MSPETFRWPPEENAVETYDLDHQAIVKPPKPGKNGFGDLRFDVTGAEELFHPEARPAASEDSEAFRPEELPPSPTGVSPVPLPEPVRTIWPWSKPWVAPALAALVLFETGVLVGESGWLDGGVAATRRPAAAARSSGAAAPAVADWTVDEQSDLTPANPAKATGGVPPARAGGPPPSTPEHTPVGVPTVEHDRSNAREPFASVQITPYPYVAEPPARSVSDAPDIFKNDKSALRLDGSSSPAGPATPGQAASAEPGWVSIPLPIQVQVLEGRRFVGVNDGKGIVLTAGAHQLELVNDALNYRAQQRVEIAAGRTTTLGVTLPSGTLQLNAVPWAEVFIDGKDAGQTPLGNVRIPIGWHRVVFRHPELGENTQSIVVGVNASIRVSVDLRK